MNAPCEIPGDVASVEQLTGRLSGVAEETEYAASRLDRLHAGTWLGEAAEKFGDKAAQLPPKLHAAADAFRSAESAYRSYAADLSHGQAEALRAMSLWSTGESATGTWRAQVDALPAGDPGKSAPDPGAWLRNEASTVYGAAVELVDSSARRAADTLHHAADLAPKKPGFWSKAWHATTSFADGIWDGTVGMVKMAWEFSPVRALIDPKGFVHDAEGMAKALYWGTTHPVEFAKAIGDDFMKDPAHALGELVPGLIVAAATGGTGLAATAVREGAERVATVGVVTAEKIAAATRAAVEPRTVVHAIVDESAHALSAEATRAAVVAPTIENAASLRGLSADVVRKLIPENWEERPIKKGLGTRYGNPKKQGDAIFFEEGVPGHPDPLHSGPYVKVSIRGRTVRIPLEGNPTLNGVH